MEDLGYVIGFVIVIYLIGWVIQNVIVPAAGIGLIIVIVLIGIAAVSGLVYGLVMSAYNYVEALNRVFGDRKNNG